MERPTDDAEIRAHADLVFRTCLRLTGNAQDAADVSQEVFVAWLRARGTIRGPLGAWLHGTARQRALDFLRRGHRRVHHERQADAPADVDAHDDWRTHLDEALADLDGTSRALVIEHHLMGVDQGRLAARFRCTQATVSRRLTQALGKLRTLLERRGVQAAPGLFPAWFAADLRQLPCPDTLLAPVLAQAHVGGAAALLGPAVIGSGWWLWLGVAAAAAGVIALLGGAGIWWWRADTLRELERDWTTIATAHLPPIDVVVAAPITGPRYPSIERLIARLPPVDAARQQRIRTLLGSGLDSLPNRLDALAARGSIGVAPLSASQRPAADDAYALAAPLIAELVSGDALIGMSSRLADDYHAGLLGSWALRTAWFQRLPDVQLASRLLTILSDRAERADDPLPILAEIDAVVATHRRSQLVLIDGMVGVSLAFRRDALHLRLIYANRLPEANARRWCAEACPLQTMMADVILGETLLMNIPLIEDVRAGRSVAPLNERWDPIGPLYLAREMAWLPQRITAIHAALHGDGRARFRQLEGEAASVITKIAWPALSASLAHAAEAAGAHHARRHAAALLLAARAGRPLPDALPDLAAGPADTWKMRYVRISPTRFRLLADPTAGRPAYVDEHITVANKLGLPRAGADTRAFEDHGLGGIEIEVPAADTAPTLPPRADDSEEPPPPRAVQ